MPEGPEIKYNSIWLNKELKGNKILDIKALSKKRVYIPKKSTIVSVLSKGKLLFIETKDYFVHIHFGITGWIYLDEEPDYTKYIITTDKNTVYIDSMRKFTKLKIYTKKTHESKLKKLGVDILSKDFTYNYFKDVLQNTSQVIAPLLLKQSKFAGLGNYIKNEAMYIAKIHPKTKSNLLDEKEMEKLFSAIKHVSFSVLVELIKNNGLKLDSETKKILPKIKIPYNFKIYGRQKDINGKKVKKEKIGGRWTYFVL